MRRPPSPPTAPALPPRTDAAGEVPLGASLLGMAEVASGWGRQRAALVLRAAGQAMLAGTRPPTPALHRLAYVSRATAADGAEAAGHLAGILAVAQAHNAEAGLTGALLHSRRWFAQVLEGERGALEALYARIERDPRHREVTLLALHPATRRVFPGWCMVDAGQAPERLMRRAMAALGDGAAVGVVMRDLMATLQLRLRAA